MALATLGVLGLSPQVARAEAFVDLRAGAAFTSNATKTLKLDGVFASNGSSGFEQSASVGLRGGYWLERVPWLGFALDFSYFNGDEDAPSGAPQLELDVFPISALLMLRTRLWKDADFPRGRVQPYAAIGPGAFVTDASLDLASVGGPEFSSTEVDAGIDLRLGVDLNLLPAWPEWALFTEYRFTHFGLRLRDNAAGVQGDVETQLDTHHIVLGVGYHF